MGLKTAKSEKVVMLSDLALEKTSEQNAFVIAKGEFVHFSQLKFGNAQSEALRWIELYEIQRIEFTDVSFFDVVAVFVFVDPAQWKTVRSTYIGSERIDPAGALII